MELDSSTSIAILILLLMLSMLFSASETALTSLSRIRLRHMVDEKVKGAILVDKLMEHQHKLLTTVLIGNNIVNIAASAMSTQIALSYASNNKYTVPIVTLTLTVIILIFGEVIPKSVANAKSEKISLIVAPVINFCTYLFAPLGFLINSIATFLLKLLGIELNSKSETFTESELKTIVNVSHEEGVLEIDERTMINNVFDFADMSAEQVMTPRTDMIAVSVNSSYSTIMEIFEQERFSRMPVYGESFDDILGILYLKDLIFGIDENGFNINDYIRDAFFTYEAKEIGKLFADMKSGRISMAIVLDEYGGTAGLLTLQDIVEEILGDILDEDDDAIDDIYKLSEHTYSIDGTVRLDELNEEIESEFTSDDFESIGGYIVGLFGHFPDKDAKITDTHDGVKYSFKVLNVDKNRVERIKLTIEHLTEESETDVATEQ
ncbi:MAG: hemolysin family protein [Lachnospirales bacterium]